MGDGTHPDLPATLEAAEMARLSNAGIPTRSWAGMERKEARVDAVRAVVVAGEWIQGRTSPALAAAWDVSESAVRAYYSEVLRGLLRDTMESREELRAELSNSLQVILRGAMEDRDYRAAILAVKTRAQILGMLVNQHEVRSFDAMLRGVGSMSKEELADRAREIADKIQQRIAIDVEAHDKEPDNG
jgi:hypothetical protein